MESPTLPPKPKKKDFSFSVDTSRPFRSVKEAVAIFGQRIIVGEIYTHSPRPYYTPPSEEISWRFSSSSPENPKEDDHHGQIELLGSLKRLEAEMEETKTELKLLKERESVTEIALASLNAELHKKMSKLAEAEAAAAKKAAATRTASFERVRKEGLLREEERIRDLMIRMEKSSTLAEILGLGEQKGYPSLRGKKEKRVMKKKPIVHLVDLFFKKKGPSNTLNNPL